MHTYLCTHTLAPVHVRTHTHTCAHTRTRTHPHAQIPPTHTWMHARTRAYARTDTHMRAPPDPHAHANTWSPLDSCSAVVSASLIFKHWLLMGLACVWQLGLHTKPVGFLNAAGYYDALLAFFDNCVSSVRTPRPRPDIRYMDLVMLCNVM
jgi:hypothetical protein